MGFGGVSLGHWDNHWGETRSRPWEKRGARAYEEGEIEVRQKQKILPSFFQFSFDPFMETGFKIYWGILFFSAPNWLYICVHVHACVHVHTHTHTHTWLKFQDCLPLNLCLCSYQQVIDTLLSVQVNQAITWWDFLVGKMLQMLYGDKTKVFPQISCSIAKSCLTVCDRKDCGMPSFPVLHRL